MGASSWVFRDRIGELAPMGRSYKGFVATISQLLNGVFPYSGENVVCRPASINRARSAPASG